MSILDKEVSWSQKTKDHWLAIMQEHLKADRLIRGSWTKDEDANGIFKGCFFGCAMQTGNNPLGKAVKAMNLPDWLIRLSEKIYEGLPESDHLDWPVKFLQAIPVETELYKVRHQLAILRLTSLADKNPSVSEAINQVITYHENIVSDQFGDEAAWSAARSAARSAAWSAAESAAESAAWSAEESAARSAAWSAARSAAWSAAESAEAKNLIDLLKGAK